MIATESDTASSSQTEGDVVSPPRDDSQEALNEGLRDLKLSEHGSGDVLEGIDGGEKELDLESGSPKKGKEGKVAKPKYPLRPGQPDCSFYARYASCRFGMKCKFNHPNTPKKKKSTKAKPGKGSDADQKSGDKEKEVSSEYVEQKESQDANEEKSKVTIEEKELEETEKISLPTKKADSNASKGKEKESISEARVQECKYFSTPGGCKFGKSCRYLHPEGKPDAPPVELNFLGLPIRPNERECPYYMRTGSCKYSTNCKFHHPDPKAVASQGENHDSNNKRNNYGTEKAPPTTQAHPTVPVPSMPSWREQGTAMKEPMPYVAAPPPTYAHGMIPHGIFPNQDWNGYQVPVNPYFVPVQSYQPPSVSHASMHHQPTPFDEYPERPGQPECQHFVKNGFCKYKLACKYHHPKVHASSNPPANLTSVGLPLKPDQPVCVYYTNYGVCKYGPSCRYHHPLHQGPPAAITGPQSS